MVRPLSIGKRLLVHSPADPKAASLISATADWGCLVTTAETIDELRGRIEGGDYDMVLVDDSRTIKRLALEADASGDILRTSLAEVEKRHILRVLSSTQGNKTRAAKVLGIDTKTLYNKLKAYGAAADAARRRAAASAAAQAHSAAAHAVQPLSRLHG
jgi:DNA-binding protein Fis